jgi:hypothetical protein
MGCYINSTNERLYGAMETEFGKAASLSAEDRLSFRSLKLSENPVRSARRDKTGSRTRFAPHPEIRTDNRFELTAYFPGRDPGAPADAMTNLVESALGGERRIAAGLVVSSTGANPTSITFSAAHGLAAGEALRFGGQLRFVKSVADSTTVLLSAPFDGNLAPGSSLGTTVTLYPGDTPRSLTLGDYWNPTGALDRILAGSVIDEMEMALNSDFHGARFQGITREVASVAAFSPGYTGLSQFPAEPPFTPQSFVLVPGHIGRLHLGGVEFFLLQLSLRLRNQVDAKVREFGLGVAPCYSADLREVSVQFQLYASTKAAVTALHVMARNRQETDLSIQLGNKEGQLVGIHIPRFIPEIPELNDADSRVVMSYPSSLAYGVVNDEISIAFA